MCVCRLHYVLPHLRILRGRGFGVWPTVWAGTRVEMVESLFVWRYRGCVFCLSDPGNSFFSFFIQTFLTL